MDFLTLATERYSCKKYSGRQVDQPVLDEILEAGRVAPTAKNLQEHKVYVLRSQEALSKFDSICPCRYGAQTVLVVTFDKTNVFVYPGGKRDSGVEDATIAAAHIMLAAASKGVDSCWINNLDPDKLSNALGLPENEEILMALDLGYAAEGAGPMPNHTKRRTLEEMTVYM